MIRELARAASRLLPPGAKAGLARWRFGHGDAGRRFQVVRADEGGIARFAIDGRLRLAASGDAADSVEYHFVRDGDCRTEMDAFMAVSSAAPADALLLDVGAHVGLFSAVHLALAPGHRAVLFEPSPPLSAAAAAWMTLNGMTGRADVRCAGVGSRVETRLIATDALGFAVAATPASTATPVPFTTIDHVCLAEGVRPAIVKIDVEGHEAEVIEGARGTLLRDRPILCLELHLDMLERAGKPLDALLGALEADGYEFRRTNGRSISGAQLRRSLKAVVRVTAHPREAA